MNSDRRADTPDGLIWLICAIYQVKAVRPATGRYRGFRGMAAQALSLGNIFAETPPDGDCGWNTR
jgi:hypothetical protein